MPTLPYAEIFIWDKRYEYTSTHSKRSKSVRLQGSLKNVNCSEHKSQTFVNMFFKMYKFIRQCVLLAQWLTWLTRTVVVVIQRCRVQSPLAARTFPEQESLIT